MKPTTAIVELYNLFLPGRKCPRNGYYVFEYEHERRGKLLFDARGDEPTAREFALSFNGDVESWVD